MHIPHYLPLSWSLRVGIGPWLMRGWWWSRPPPDVRLSPVASSRSLASAECGAWGSQQEGAQLWPATCRLVRNRAHPVRSHESWLWRRPTRRDFPPGEWFCFTWPARRIAAGGGEGVRGCGLSVMRVRSAAEQRARHLAQSWPGVVCCLQARPVWSISLAPQKWLKGKETKSRLGFS